jgi:hypothetical protein
MCAGLVVEFAKGPRCSSVDGSVHTQMRKFFLSAICRFNLYCKEEVRRKGEGRPSPINVVGIYYLLAQPASTQDWTTSDPSNPQIANSITEGSNNKQTNSYCSVCNFDDDPQLISSISSTASADLISLKIADHSQPGHQQSGSMDSHHNVPALAEGDNHDTIEKDDEATMAASEELKHTTISDKNTPSASDSSAAQPESSGGDKKAGVSARESTPKPEPTDAQDEEMKEMLSSPKKKRGRDQDDDMQHLERDDVDEIGSSADGSAVNGSRTERLGPEKKRHRDISEDPLTVSRKFTEAKV